MVQWTASSMGKKGGRVRSERKTQAAKVRGFQTDLRSNARCPYCRSRLSIYNVTGMCSRWPCKKAHALAMKEADTEAKSTLSPQS